jgi:hypothetical protein
VVELLTPQLLEEPFSGVVYEGNLKWQGFRLLHAASMGGCTDLILALLQRGADVNARGDCGYDALTCVSTFVNDDAAATAAAKVLLDHGADILASDSEQRTALHWAAYLGKPRLCALLLSRGADLMARDSLGKAPLDWFGAYYGGDTASCNLEEMWRTGPHPSQVQRRRDEAWARRWPFVQVLVGHDFQPCASRRAVLKLLFPALPPHVPLPPLVGTRLQLLRNKILTHPGFWRLIASFL